MKSKIGREITCQEAVKRYYIFQIMMQNIRILYLLIYPYVVLNIRKVL
jgi:hypothetical protein